MNKTELENKVIVSMAGYMKFTSSDLYVICKNIVNVYGEDPTHQEIEDEVELFYNNN